MASYVIQRTQRLPISLSKAWDFFSTPNNLNDITPADMQMEILTDSGSGGKMFEGQIITYHVRPILNIPLHWVTEISHVKEQEYFVDNQMHGPFAMWHHLHQFKAIQGGVEMTDTVNYMMPFGPLGTVVHALMVRKQVEAIFDFRYKLLEQKFGKM